MEKNSPANEGEANSIPGSRRSPGEGNGTSLQCFWPGKSHGERSLVGYSPWVAKSQTWLSTHIGTRITGVKIWSNALFLKMGSISLVVHFIVLNLDFYVT